MNEIENCHVLDASSVPARAFTEALSRQLETTAWLPKLTWFAAGHGRQFEYGQDGALRIITVALRRGYQHRVFDAALGLSEALTKRIIAECRNAERTLLICTSPFWATVAERWPGPVVYYSLDYTYAYDGFSARRILALDTKLCRRAMRVFPVSRRIADYLVTRAGCAREKILVLPNATLSDNVQTKGDGRRGPRTAELREIEGPIAGVIGNMADNTDWILVREAMEKVGWLYWVFLGPHEAELRDRGQRRARRAVMEHRHSRFIGARPYEQLQQYARAFEVAVLPYRRKEPTYSGSATRFYEHLAAGRPMVATRNVAELDEKEPLVRLVDDAHELAGELTRLRGADFRDGWEEARIGASRLETWDVRAQVMLSGVMEAACELRAD